MLDIMGDGGWGLRQPSALSEGDCRAAVQTAWVANKTLSGSGEICKRPTRPTLAPYTHVNQSSPAADQRSIQNNEGKGDHAGKTMMLC